MCVTVIRGRICTKRWSMFFSHVIRQTAMERLGTTGKIERKRSRGRQREKLLDNLTAWLMIQNATVALACVPNRDRWRSMIADAMRHGTQ